MKAGEKVLTGSKYLQELHSATRTVDKYGETERRLLSGKPELLWIDRRTQLLFVIVSRWHCKLTVAPGDCWQHK